MTKIAIAIFIVIFFLLRPYAMQDNGLWYAGDDQDYFGHAASIAFGHFPSYNKEYLTISKYYPQSSIGSGILAVPFVWIFSFLDRWEGSNIAQERTPENIRGSWSQFGFVFGICFYFILAIFLLYRAACLYVPERHAFLATVLTTLCQGLPLFAVRRPIFSHAPEFFIQSLFVYLFLKNCVSDKKFPGRLGHYFILGCLSAILFLIRYNDIGFVLAWVFILILSSNSLGASMKQIGRVMLTFISFTGVIAIFKVWPEIYNQQHPYQWVKGHLSIHVSWEDICQRIGHIIGGLDWGLIYTAPYILIGFLAVFLLNQPIKKYFWFLIAALFVNFYIIVLWGSQGGWYGYRYFIASAVPIFVMPIAILMKNIEDKVGKQLTLLWILIAVPSTLSMLFFEGNNTTLTLHVIPQFFGRSDWSNDLYQLAVWQTVTNIQDDWQPLCKGGMYYIVYLFQAAGVPLATGKIDTFLKYPHFEWKVLIRTLMIYAMPFIVGFILSKTQLNRTFLKATFLK